MTDTNSTVIEQSILCGIPVVFFEEKNEKLDDNIKFFSSDLINTCRNTNEVISTISKIMKMNDHEISSLKDNFFKSLNISFNENITIDDFLNKLKNFN